MSISPWPPEDTSWWWNSHRIPSDSIVATISLRRFASESAGGTGK